MLSPLSKWSFVELTNGNDHKVTLRGTMINQPPFLPVVFLGTFGRLLHQGAHATRRLQELLHECLGEYEKVRLTATRRRRASAETRDSVLREKIIDLRFVELVRRI